MKLPKLTLKGKSGTGKLMMILIIIIIIIIVIYVILLLIRYFLFESLRKDKDQTEEQMKVLLAPYKYKGGWFDVIGDIQALLEYKDANITRTENTI